jgi:hypothetical protein
MSTFTFQKHLSRRAMLRGAGITLGLPLLEAMTPAFAAVKETKQAKRFVGMSLALGLHNPNLVPKGSGRSYKPSRYLEGHSGFAGGFHGGVGFIASGGHGWSHGGGEHLFGLSERAGLDDAEHDLARSAHGEASGA